MIVLKEPLIVLIVLREPLIVLIVLREPLIVLIVLREPLIVLIVLIGLNLRICLCWIAVVHSTVCPITGLTYLQRSLHPILRVDTGGPRPTPGVDFQPATTEDQYTDESQRWRAPHDVSLVMFPVVLWSDRPGLELYG